MTDLVIDTNSLQILADEEKLETIIEKHDVVYVPRCVKRKEFPSVYRHLIELRFEIQRQIDELERIGLFHEVNPKQPLRPDLESALIKKGADDCDRDIVKLCKERKGKAEDVVIISTNEEHFQKVHKLRQCCTMILPEDYPAMYEKELNPTNSEEINA